MSEIRCGMVSGGESCESEDVILLTVQVRGIIGQIVACTEHLAESAQSLCTAAIEAHDYGFEMIEVQAMKQAFGEEPW